MVVTYYVKEQLTDLNKKSFGGMNISWGGLKHVVILIATFGVRLQIIKLKFAIFKDWLCVEAFHELFLRCLLVASIWVSNVMSTYLFFSFQIAFYRAFHHRLCCSKYAKLSKCNLSGYAIRACLISSSNYAIVSFCTAMFDRS